MAKVQVEYDEKDIKELIVWDLMNKFDVDFSVDEIAIMVQSKQNYRSTEWENGKLKCTIDVRK